MKHEKTSVKSPELYADRRRHFPTEAAYLLGLLALAIGTTWMVRADFGVSMVVAPAYVLFRKAALYFPWVTFGMAEYALQTVLLLLLCAALRRFRLRYLFAIPSALLYALFLDGSTWLIACLPFAGLAYRVFCYLFGMLVCALGVAFLFHTYITQEVYELVVVEAARVLRKKPHRCKTVYDCLSCLVAVLLSFLFFGFGEFVGVRWGTVVCALVNGTLIGWCSAAMERLWRFTDCLPYRRFFTEPPQE